MASPMNIKYTGDDSEGFDLGLLGESFSGMSAILKEMSELTGINGEIEIRTTKITHGSVDLHNALQIALTGLPFNTPQDLYDFLQVASPEKLEQAKAFLSGALGVREDINSYFARYPLEGTVLMALAGKFIAKTWGWASKQKGNLTITDDQLGEISITKARKLRGMVKKGKFRHVLQPIAQGNVSSIKVTGGQGQDKVSAVVTEHNLESYLPEDDQILPEYENGSVNTFTGLLTNLQSARGEILKIKVDNIDRAYSLVTARPHDGQTTEDYTQYYHKPVTFTAEVVRASMFKRPEFVIQEMSISQQQILPQEDDV